MTWEYSEGLSLRDEFALRAPAVPDWFKPKMDSNAPPITVRFGDPAHDAQILARTAWYTEQRRQTLSQWPYAWADIMLAERERKSD